MFRPSPSACPVSSARGSWRSSIPGPFVDALVVLIVIPLGLAAAIQRWTGRLDADRRVMVVAEGLVVPLMMLTLAVVFAAQIGGIGQELTSLLAVAPLHTAFLLVMVPLGSAVARATRLDPGSTTAVVFSGVTRSCVVVLPLPLAEPLALVGLVVVTQTLFHLIGMVVYVKFIPRVIASRPRTRR